MLKDDLAFKNQQLWMYRKAKPDQTLITLLSGPL